MNNLQDLLVQVRENTREGSRRTLRKALAEVLANRHEYYRRSLAEGSEEALADALYKALLLELDEEEEEGIEAAELAYLLLSSVIKSPAANREHYKNRLLLLHYFADYFTDAVIEVFLAAYREEHLLQARNLALECIDKMQLADMFHLEEHAPEFLEQDEQLVDACNAIEMSPDLPEEERLQASLLHQVLSAYLRAKYK